jgi:membrane associated rhomboid family serine protease
VILLPLRGEDLPRGVPWVTTLLVLVNVVAFGWQLQHGNAATEQLGFVPARFASIAGGGDPPGQAVASTLFTSMFVHGNLLHLVSNMVYLWVFGTGVEVSLGAARYLFFYLASGLGGHFAQFLASPHSHVPTIGASGAISGILAAYLIRFPSARVKSLLFLFVFLRWVRVPAFLLIGYWLLIQVLNGAAELGGVGSGGVAWFEHIGGFFAGFLLFPVAHVGREK